MVHFKDHLYIEQLKIYDQKIYFGDPNRTFKLVTSLIDNDEITLLKIYWEYFPEFDFLYDRLIEHYNKTSFNKTSSKETHKFLNSLQYDLFRDSPMTSNSKEFFVYDRVIFPIRDLYHFKS
jgi:hypothetical protein